MVHQLSGGRGGLMDTQGIFWGHVRCWGHESRGQNGWGGGATTKETNYKQPSFSEYYHLR